MGTDTAPLRSGEVVPVRGEPTAIPQHVVDTYVEMVATVPDAGGDGYASILAALALATDAADLDAPWRSEGLEAFTNTELVVTGIRKLPSDYAGGLPFFLIIDGAVSATGETVSITTGSIAPVGQLVRAHALGAFPLRVIPRKAERQSRAGYWPMHLEVVRQ